MNPHVNRFTPAPRLKRYHRVISVGLFLVGLFKKKKKKKKNSVINKLSIQPRSPFS